MSTNNTKNEIIVDELPKCDFCNNRACYDMKIAVGGYWAYVCEEHRCFGIKLGVGYGQKLINIGYTPSPIHRVIYYIK